MSAIRKLDRQAICATCLSQDRKLFSVIDVAACAKFYCELFLTQTDKVCWECHHTVRKIIAFKNKARKAQALLQAAEKGQHSKILCLSALDISMGIFLNVTDPGLTTTTSDSTPAPVFVTVKLEVDGDESIHSDERVGSGVDEDRDGVKVKEEEIDVPVFKIPKPIERKAPAPIEILTQVQYPHTQRGASLGALATSPSGIQHRIAKPAKRKAYTPIEVPIVDQLDLYTEENLSEDGLLEWWQKKKKMKYYTQSIPPERCDKCVQPLDGQLVIKSHAKKHTEIYGDLECDICTLRLIDERELECHRKLHYRILKCRFCEFTWDDVNSVRQHCSDAHGVRQAAWDCGQCDKRFPSAKKFSSHLRNHRRAQCPQCGKSFAGSNLKMHMIQHRGGKPLHTCGECGGQFRGAEGLKTHMKIHSTEVDPAAFCAECNIQFRGMQLLRCHMKSNRHADASQYRFKCKECDMKFLKRGRLRLHMEMHSDVMYPCDQCEKSFNSRRSRYSHVKKKHEGRGVSRDKLCDHCGKGFSSKSQLSSHINTHTGARPFVCELCGADFGHKSALYLHGRYKHHIQKKTKPVPVGDKNTVTDSGHDNSKNNDSGKDRMET